MYLYRRALIITPEGMVKRAALQTVIHRQILKPDIYVYKEPRGSQASIVSG
jgi:hypothetical protein